MSQLYEFQCKKCRLAFGVKRPEGNTHNRVMFVCCETIQTHYYGQKRPVASFSAEALRPR